MKGRRNQTSKNRGDERKRRLKLTMTIANRWERSVVVVETGLHRHLARGTEEQNAQPCNSTARRIPGHPAFKNANIDASPIALSREAIGVAFKKGGHNWEKKKKLLGTKARFFFQRLVHRPGAVCQSSSECTLHWLEHLEVCSSLIII